MEFPSKLLEKAVEEIAKLPGIGKKTALRLALHLLKQDSMDVTGLSDSLTNLRDNITYCGKCHNISDTPLCAICSNPGRDQSLVCITEDVRNVMAIENTGQYRGVYHVLGGVISPIEGIGPSELKIDDLVKRVEEGEINEIILALSPTMEGDTTAFYITKRLKATDITITTIARGIPIGGDLEYADEITLGRSILTRTAYSQ